MAELHENLTWLNPTSWEDVPKDDISAYLSQCFTAAELLVNSIPPPADGTPFEEAEPQFKIPNAAKSAKDVRPSPARAALPCTEHAELQKNWGKPMKFKKENNPLEIALYKMAGKDRHGSWFARHNVIEGVGFGKLSKAMQREFPESLLSQGGPGAGAKRGLAADRRVEKQEAPGVGTMEVYQLSGKMPAPVSPRDFTTLFMTTEDALTDKSAAAGSGETKYVPRHLLVVSRPLQHPETPARSDFVRGQYESVEMIREIPLHTLKTKPATNGTATNGEAEADVDPELNPVEWIMVTRSDPGGGIPRFLVDRGTPDAMLGDVTKFLDWVCGTEEIADRDADLEQQQESSADAAVETQQDVTVPPEPVNANAPAIQSEVPMREVSAAPLVNEQPHETGFVASVTSTIGAGIDAYAPTSVSNYIHGTSSQHLPVDDEDTSDSSDDSSSDSFISAKEGSRTSTARDTLPQHTADVQSRDSTETISLTSSSAKAEPPKDLSKNEKELQKISKQRTELDSKLAKKRREEEGKFSKMQERDQTDLEKQREKMDKELKKSEEQHRKKIDKLEAKRQKELRKAEERRNKKSDQNRLSLVALERDELRSQAELLRKENALLAAQVESLQRENGVLTERVEKMGGLAGERSMLDEAKKGEGLQTDSRVSLESGAAKE